MSDECIGFVIGIEENAWQPIAKYEEMIGSSWLVLRPNERDVMFLRIPEDSNLRCQYSENLIFNVSSHV